MLENFKNHTNYVTDLSWDKNDNFLVSVGLDGGIYQYSLVSCTKEEENISRTTEYRGVTYLGNEHLVSCGIDNNFSLLREIQGEEVRTFTLGAKPRLSHLL
mmetsp:Transcript_29928/g.5407  ORF Transcript_29928/g.5407 Transcript_29928/m.5407 type:complete len:101 (+) Transcript_29928:1489-1791(+)